MGVKEAIIIKHINAAAELRPMRFDEPNMPLDTTPPLVNPTPSKWRLTIQELTSALSGGISAIRNLIARALRAAGFGRAFIDILMAMPDISMDVLWAIGYSLAYPGTNLTETVWDEIMHGIVRYYNIPSPLDDEILSAYNSVKYRGIFIFGDIFAAIERGWPVDGCLKWIIGIHRYGLSYYWPQTWDEAEGILRDFEEIEGIVTEEEDPEMLPGSWPGY
jgi:hypothetical protein